MRKFILGTLALSCLLLSGTAFAEATYSFDDIYMTAAAGNTTRVDDFNLGQQPFLYFRFMDKADTNIVGTVSNSTTSWDRGSDNTRFVYYDQAPAQNGVWVSFTPENWNSIDPKTGEWDVEASTLLTYKEGIITKQSRYTGCASFRVVPEPISAVLFLFGAGSLAYATRSRKKKA